MQQQIDWTGVNSDAIAAASLAAVFAGATTQTKANKEAMRLLKAGGVVKESSYESVAYSQSGRVVKDKPVLRGSDAIAARSLRGIDERRRPVQRWTVRMSPDAEQRLRETASAPGSILDELEKENQALREVVKSLRYQRTSR